MVVVLVDVEAWAGVEVEEVVVTVTGATVLCTLLTVTTRMRGLNLSECFFLYLVEFRTHQYQPHHWPRPS
jgi:hypothetical protein